MNWPFYVKARIVPSHSPRLSRSVEFRHLIEYFGVVIESEKAMSKPFGDIQHTPILRRKLDGHPLFESGNVGTQINDDIVNGSHCAADQFRFFKRSELIMHPTKRGLVLVKRNIALDPFWMQAVSCGFSIAPAPGEESTFVFQPLRINNKRALQLGLSESHRSRQ